MVGVMAKGRSCRVMAFLRHFCSDLGAIDGIFEPAKSEKVARVKYCHYAPQVARGGGGITSVMGGAWLPHLCGLLHQIGET